MVRQNPTAGKSKRMAAYVDELKTLKERRKERAGILQYVDKIEERAKAIIIYGSPATDADNRIKNIIAQTKGTWNERHLQTTELGSAHGTTNRESKK